MQKIDEEKEKLTGREDPSVNEQKKKNVAVMYIGEDLDVLLELSDRIMVLCHGRITGVVDARETTKEEIGMMMTGENIVKEEEALR